MAYNPKKIEFQEFCDAIYPKEHNPRIVTIEKKFTFMYYTAYRKKELEEVVMLTKRNNLI